MPLPVCWYGYGKRAHLPDAATKKLCSFLVELIHFLKTGCILCEKCIRGEKIIFQASSLVV
jgi:hypothetical protein